MADTYLVGVDGSEGSKRAARHAVERARRMGFELVVVYVIDWSPYTFNTPEENAQRHRRRESEIRIANERVLEPLLAELATEGVSVTGLVRHGNIPEVMNRLAREHAAYGVFIGRIGNSGIASLLFGSVTSRMVQTATVPVTVVP